MLLLVIMPLIVVIIFWFHNEYHLDSGTNMLENHESADIKISYATTDSENTSWSRGSTWYFLPLDLEFTSNLYLRFIEREQFYVAEDVQTIVNDNVYVDDHIWFTDKIHFKIVNISNYHYYFAQSRRVAKLIDGEWFGLHGHAIAVNDWLGVLHANESIEWYLWPTGLFPEGYIFDGGTYKLIKPVWREYLSREYTTWAYLIVQLD